MFTTTLNTLPLLLTLMTGFGVVIHDMKIDHAAVTAMSASAAVAAHGSLSGVPDMRSNDHVHTESIRLAHMHKVNNPDPRLQTRDTDIRKYLATKKLAVHASPV